MQRSRNVAVSQVLLLTILTALYLAAFPAAGCETLSAARRRGHGIGTNPENAYNLNFSVVPRQVGPNSCGAAVLAGILALRSGSAPDETALLASDSALSAAAVEGLSLADMLDALASRGIHSAAFRCDYGGLEAAISRYGPTILHYDEPAAHFALALAADDGTVIVADPADGLRTLERTAFEFRWSGFIVAMESEPWPSASADLVRNATTGALHRRNMLAADVSGCGQGAEKSAAPATWCLESGFTTGSGLPRLRIGADFDPSTFLTVGGAIEMELFDENRNAVEIETGFEWRPRADRAPGPALGIRIAAPPFTWGKGGQSEFADSDWILSAECRLFGVEDPLAWNCALSGQADLPNFSRSEAAFDMLLVYAVAPTTSFSGSIRMESSRSGVRSGLGLRRCYGRFSFGVETGLWIGGDNGAEDGVVSAFLELQG